MTKRRPIARRILLCVLIGTALTVFVAVIPANIPHVRKWLQDDFTVTGHVGYGGSRYRVESTAGLVHDHLTASRVYMRQFASPGKLTQEQPPAPILERSLHQIAVLRESDSAGPRTTLSHHRFGFPLRCLECTFVGPSPTEYITKNGWVHIEPMPGSPQYAASRSDGMIAWILVPYGIRPVGLVVNVSFFAMLAWIVPAAVQEVRGIRRRRRGRCPRCAYDLAHDYRGGCPECGWRRLTPASPA